MSSPRIFGIPCWIFPFLAGFAWLATLLLLITSWVLHGSIHYPEMLATQNLAYISNVGASTWGQPPFIVGCATTALLFSITFLSERWLRHQGRLMHYESGWSTFIWFLAALLTVVASVAQISMTIFCVRHHGYIHYSMVAIFALGYIFAASLICVEKKLLCNHYPTNTVLRRSLQIKSFFIAIEIVFVILGSVTMYKQMYRTSVIIEWIAALFFTFYMTSFAIDFLAIPVVNEKDDVTSLGLRSWDLEANVRKPERVYILRYKEDIASA